MAAYGYQTEFTQSAIMHSAQLCALRTQKPSCTHAKWLSRALQAAHNFRIFSEPNRA